MIFRRTGLRLRCQPGLGAGVLFPHLAPLNPPARDSDLALLGSYVMSGEHLMKALLDSGMPLFRRLRMGATAGRGARPAEVTMFGGVMRAIKIGFGWLTLRHCLFGACRWEHGTRKA